MGADNVLVKGAATAYKNRDAAGMKAAAQGLDKITQTADKMVAAQKEKKEALKKERDVASKSITKIATNMAENYKSLGKEEFGVWKNDVSVLREEMNAALEPPRDEDAIMDINLKLSELKSKGMKAKDGYEAIMEGWQGDPKTKEPIWDTKAMTDEGIDAHDNFMKNPTRKFVRNEDGEDAYSWDVLGDDGEPVQRKTPAGDLMTDASGQPMYETQTYTLDELNDFTVLPPTESATKYMDHITEKTQLFSETQGDIKVEDLRNEVSEMIPKDEKALRSWAKSNPTKSTNLDIEKYLEEHPLLNKGFYKDLGIKDVSGPDGVKDNIIDEHDLVSAGDKDMIVQAIMNADNPDITHSVLTDIYTTIGYNTIHKIEYKENEDGTYQGNKDYTPSDTKLMQDNIDIDVITGEQRAQTMEKLKALSDPANLKQYESMTEEAIASRIGVDPKKKILNPKSGEYETITTYIANATNKKAAAKGGSLDNI